MTGDPFDYTSYAATPFYYGSDCFVMDKDEDYKWEDEICYFKNAYICETPAKPATAWTSREYLLARKSFSPVVQTLVQNITTPYFLQCGSSCVANENCTTFAYNEQTGDCRVAGPVKHSQFSSGFDLYSLYERKPEDTSKNILVGDEQGKKVWMADVDKMVFSEIPVGVTWPFKAALDPLTGYVYAAQYNTLSRGTVDGSAMETIEVTGDSSERITDISIDARSRRLFAVVQTHSRIMGFYVDTESLTSFVLVDTGLNNPRCVHAVPLRGHVYFGDDDEIERIDVDGSNRVVIASNPSLTHIVAIAVDTETEKIFAIDWNEEDIFYMNLDGTDLGAFPSITSGVRGLACHGGLLYWMDEDSTLRVTTTIPNSTVTTEGNVLFAGGKFLSIN
ncbi:uncharacterized protein [Diadema setosum]|uniref:uncharacterized protein n=1 Tax=Diadema setosum TaxID=31175 RepID=UPI003B3B72F9